MNATRMCSAQDFFDGNPRRVVPCLIEVFRVLQMRDIWLRAQALLRAMHGFLSQMGRPLSYHVLHDPMAYGNQLIADFSDGTRVMSLLVVHGLARVGEMRQLRGNLRELDHWIENGSLLNQALERAGIPVVLAPGDWLAPAGLGSDFLVFQLSLIWDRLREAGAAFGNTPSMQPSAPDDSFVFSDGAPLAMSQQALDASSARALEAGRLVRAARLDHLQNPQGSVNGTPEQRAVKPEEASLERFMIDFVEFLLARFGTFDAAFERMDPAGSGQVTFADFMRVTKAEGFPGGVESLVVIWQALVPPGCNVIVPEDLMRAEMYVPKEEPEEVEEDEGVSESYEAQEEREIALLVHEEQIAWEAPSIVAVAIGGQEEGQEARFPGFAEERTWLFFEELRRRHELVANAGKSLAARRAASVATAAAEAAQQLLDETLDGTQFNLEPELQPVDGTTPTTSIDARVVLSDSTEERVWLQTGVISSAGASGEGDDTVLVLEVRERSCDSGVGGYLRAQVDVSQIFEVFQMGPGNLQSTDSADVCFSVSAHVGADLRGASAQVASTADRKLLGRHAVEVSATETCDRMRKYLKTRFGSLRKAFNALGSDDLGILSTNEFRQGLDRLEVPWAEITGIPRLQTVIKALDVTGQGFVSADELNRIRYDAPLFHTSGDDGAITLLFIAGPTVRRRREAVNFFDELRILAHFVASGAVGPLSVAEPAERISMISSMIAS